MESPLLQRTGRPSPLLLEAFPEDLRVGEEQEQSVPTPGAGQGGTRLAGSGKRPMRNMGIRAPPTTPVGRRTAQVRPQETQCHGGTEAPAVRTS